MPGKECKQSCPFVVTPILDSSPSKALPSCLITADKAELARALECLWTPLGSLQGHEEKFSMVSGLCHEGIALALRCEGPVSLDLYENNQASFPLAFCCASTYFHPRAKLQGFDKRVDRQQLFLCAR